MGEPRGSEPVVVTRSREGGLSYKPRLYGDGQGRFWLAWIESAARRPSVLLLSRSQDNGRTWSPPQQVSGDNSLDRRTLS